MEIDEEELVEEIKSKMILHWNYRDYKNLPETLKYCGDHVQEIYLKENKLSLLPKWISQLSNITNLYLSRNNFSIFPNELVTLKQLRILDLSDNHIESLPMSMQNLKTLTDLILDDNYLHQLPPEMCQLQCLKTLSMCQNKFYILPEWLGSLMKLETLLVDNNYLEELPNRLTLSPALNAISICANRLKYLPLNSFISPINIQFNCNPNLNYLSYSMLSQLLELGWEDEKNCSAINKNIRIHSGNIKKNIKLEVNLSLSSVTCEKRAIVELPRQLLNIFGIDCKIPVSLWELSLRTLYKNKYENSLDEYQRRHDICYNLLTNGPTSVCLNNQCQEPIFTEAWIIVGKSEECTTFLVITFFCSQRCASSFDMPSHGINTLTWDFYNM